MPSVFYELTYEGMSRRRALIIDTLTDNKNRMPVMCEAPYQSGGYPLVASVVFIHVQTKSIIQRCQQIY